MNPRLGAIAAAFQEALLNETRPAGIAWEALDVGQPPAAELARGNGSCLGVKSSTDEWTGELDDREAAPQCKLTSFRAFLFGATRFVAALRRI